MDLSFHLAVPAVGWARNCALCGQPVRDGDTNLTVEERWEDIAGSSFKSHRVWHSTCHEQYLEEGEAT